MLLFNNYNEILSWWVKIFALEYIRIGISDVASRKITQILIVLKFVLKFPGRSESRGF